MDPYTPRLFVPFAALIFWHKKPLRSGATKRDVSGLYSSLCRVLCKTLAFRFGFTANAFPVANISPVFIVYFRSRLRHFSFNCRATTVLVASRFPIELCRKIARCASLALGSPHLKISAILRGFGALK